jgi:putative OPT family oligopeptide transporter
MTEEAFQPYIPAEKKIKEFSFRATLLGLFFGFIFAIGNAYLGLKTGTTVSASIPAAILSMAVLKILFKNSTILENNIVQTIATVGEGLAAGIVFTVPALIFLGDTPSIFRIFLLSALGGILGILFMIPMRRFIIVKEHGILPFPEGTACAEILKAGEKSGSVAILAAWGFLVGAVYKICSNIIYLWEEIPSFTITKFKNTIFSMDSTPSLLGIGYIIGPRISALMLGGGALAWWVIIPLIKIAGVHGAVIYPSTIPIDLMSAQEIWSSYVRYIGAGCVAIGGILSLFRIAPVIYKTIHVGFKELFQGFKKVAHIERTDKDISLKWLILGSIAIILALWLIPIAGINFFTIILLVVLGFFFVAVTSLTVGLVGSTSNPASGMTITTLLITCFCFLALGWTDKVYLLAAITMSCVANVAIAMAGTTSQDLKTGFLLGSTPRSQQIAEILGVIIPALALGGTIYILNEAYTLGSAKMPAPQATLMALIAKGVMTGQLPFQLVTIGIIIGLIIALLGIPILPFAIGLYLPLSLSTAIMVGGIAAWYTNKHKNAKHAKEQGILISSGLIGGDAFLGIIIALLTVTKVISPDTKAILPSYVSYIAYFLMAIFLIVFTLKKRRNKNDINV